MGMSFVFLRWVTADGSLRESPAGDMRVPAILPVFHDAINDPKMLHRNPNDLILF